LLLEAVNRRCLQKTYSFWELAIGGLRDPDSFDENIRHLEGALGKLIRVTNGFDAGVGRLFRQGLKRAGLEGTWWTETV